MKQIITMFLCILVFNACQMNTKSEGKDTLKVEKCPLKVKYNTWKGYVLVENGQISQTSIQHEYDNPVSGTPSDTKSTNILDQVKLSEASLATFKADILSSKFMDLEEAYYGASEDERHYPYSIEVQVDCISKTVLFRSNPNYKEAPEAFKNLEKLINNFASEQKSN